MSIVQDNAVLIWLLLTPGHRGNDLFLYSETTIIDELGKLLEADFIQRNMYIFTWQCLLVKYLSLPNVLDKLKSTSCGPTGSKTLCGNRLT